MLGQETHQRQRADALAAAALAHDAEGGAAPQRIADIVDHRAAAEGHGEVLYFKYDITLFHASITRVWRKKYVGRPLFFPSDCESKSRKVKESKSQRVIETTRLRDNETSRRQVEKSKSQKDEKSKRLRDCETARRQVEKSKSRKVEESKSGRKE